MTISRAEATGIASFALSIILWVCPAEMEAVTSVFLVMAPPTLFVLLCGVAPFFPSWSFFLPIICSGPRCRNAVAISFDDGPDRITTPLLLDLLDRHGIKASFFVIGQYAAANPDLLARIRDSGHEIGNHSMSHDPLLMLRSMKKLEAEIAQCQDLLASNGIRSLAFRPPVGITNPRLGPVLKQHRLKCVCFSCRPADFGNRRLAYLADRVLKRVKAGDILLLHDCLPSKDTNTDVWLREIDRVIVGLGEKGLEIVPMSELLGHRIMDPIPKSLATTTEPAFGR